MGVEGHSAVVGGKSNTHKDRESNNHPLEEEEGGWNRAREDRTLLLGRRLVAGGDGVGL